ncbi:MAG TPA: efflux transporter outer membrane subunit [Rhodocyclaceae bacterium]|nr:efflux transporter outer membrane subunit [Rhodocyclaceae bacterium]
MKRRSLRMHHLAMLALPALLAACAVGPDYKRPDAPMAAAWKTDPGWQVAQPRDGELKGEWWKIFNDADLDALQTRALTDSQTLQSAAARLEQARAQARVAGSALFPTVGVQAGATRDRISADRPVTNYSIVNQSTVQNDFTAGFSVSYEADLFGGVRRSIESANATAAQAQADFENVRLVLTAEIAGDYFSLRENDTEIDLLEKILVAQTGGLKYIKDRYDLGAASALDLRQQEALTAATQSQLIQLRDQRARYEHALATLIGVPAPSFSLPRNVNLAAVPNIPLTAPSALLERRPDIASAERAMAAANAQIGVAKSAWFPSVPLTAGYGRESNEWSTLFSAPAAVWAFGVSATQTLFDGGRRSAGVILAEAGYRQSVADYRQSVLSAMQEVQDGLSSTTALAQAVESSQQAATAADAALQLANDSYTLGAATHLVVLQAEQSQLTYQRELVQLRGQQLLNAVKLVKALGGGWYVDAPVNDMKPAQKEAEGVNNENIAR